MSKGSGHSCANRAGLSQPHLGCPSSFASSVSPTPLAKQHRCEELSETREESVIDRLPGAEDKARLQPSSRSERLPNQRGVALSSGSPNPPPREVEIPCNDNESQLRPDGKSPTVQVAQDSQRSGRKLRPKKTGEDLVATPSLKPPQGRGKKHSGITRANKTPRGANSKIQLTQEALKKLNRRATQPIFPPRLAPIDRVESRSESCLSELRRLANRGGPDLCDLRGYLLPGISNPIAGAMQPRIQETRTISASSDGFERELIEHGIYPNRFLHPGGCRVPKPENWDEISRRLTEPRRDLSPSRYTEEKFDTFMDDYDRTIGENGKAFAAVVGEADVQFQEKPPFKNLAPLNNGRFTKGTPDFCDEASEEMIDKRVKDELWLSIVTSERYGSPCSPNFFAEFKASNASPRIARLQACYDGALGARAMQSIRSFGVEPGYDNKAYTISATFNDGLLGVYTHHPTVPAVPGGYPEYHMNRIGAFSMVGNVRQFREGATVLRNAREWAKEQRDNFIAVANGKARDMPAAPHTAELTENNALSPPAAQTVSTGTAPSAGGLGLDANAICNPHKRRRDASSSEGESRRVRGRQYSTGVSAGSPLADDNSRGKPPSGPISARGAVGGEAANESGS